MRYGSRKRRKMSGLRRQPAIRSRLGRAQMPELRHDKTDRGDARHGIRAAVHEKSFRRLVAGNACLSLLQLQRRTGSRQTGNRARLPVLRVPLRRGTGGIRRPAPRYASALFRRKAKGRGNRFALGEEKTFCPRRFQKILPRRNAERGLSARLYLRRGNLYRLFGRALRALYRNRNGQRKARNAPQNADLFRLGRLSKIV